MSESCKGLIRTSGRSLWRGALRSGSPPCRAGRARSAYEAPCGVERVTGACNSWRMLDTLRAMLDTLSAMLGWSAARLRAGFASACVALALVIACDPAQAQTRVEVG